ncbi:MAG TPA: hypothetical protein VJP80_00375 [Candidatus Saccharimonadales bacterium]|nr:hypothetical protein [Candidatus Saccharimonadales bacterium]
MSLGGSFAWYKYSDDLGNLYVIKLSVALATAIGFQAATGPPGPGTGQAWAFHEKHLRHVNAYYLSSGRKVYERFPMPTITAAYYKTGVTFSYAGQTWTVEGTTGEHKDGRNEPPQI